MPVGKAPLGFAGVAALSSLWGYLLITGERCDEPRYHQG